jgi:hypothetical protein
VSGFTIEARKKLVVKIPPGFEAISLEYPDGYVEDLALYRPPGMTPPDPEDDPEPFAQISVEMAELRAELAELKTDVNLLARHAPPGALRRDPEDTKK